MTAETQIAAVIVAAIKAALAPVLADVKSLQTQLSAADARWQDVGALRERLAVIESRAPMPGPIGPAGEKGDAGERGEKGLDGAAGAPGLNGKDGADGLHGKDGLNGRDGAEGVAGKDGAPGLNGKDGATGAPGRDGTLESLKAIQSEDLRTITLCFKNGDPIEGGVLRFPVTIYRGVYVHGKSYEAGDSVSFSGATWIAKQDTSDKPGDGATGWQLAVKTGRAGRDGQPGKDGKDGLNGKDGRLLTAAEWMAAPRG